MAVAAPVFERTCADWLDMEAPFAEAGGPQSPDSSREPSTVGGCVLVPGA